MRARTPGGCYLDASIPSCLMWWLLCAVALVSSLLLLSCIPFDPRWLAQEPFLLRAPQLSTRVARPATVVYPTQFITPDRTDSDSRNITLSTTTLRGRSVYILEWSSALEEEEGEERSSNGSRCHRLSVLAALGGAQRSRTKSRSRHEPLERPSLLASRFGCQYAVNAGPFRRSGEPVGSVASSAGRVCHFEPPSADFVGFGVTKPQANASASWVFGSVTTAEELESLRDFVTGFGWLVYGGKSVVVEPDDEERTGAVRAPRTAFGVTAHGTLVVMVADGCEKCLYTRGPTLSEMSEILISKGVQFSVNMDGGGSSVLVGRNRNDVIDVLSHPTCWDVGVQCERPVATVLCLK